MFLGQMILLSCLMQCISMASNITIQLEEVDDELRLLSNDTNSSEYESSDLAERVSIIVGCLIGVLFLGFSIFGIVMVGSHNQKCVKCVRKNKRKQRRIRYIISKLRATSSKSDPRKEACIVCLQELSSSVIVTKCNHFFHEKCLEQWIRVKFNCPTCRS